MGFNDFDNDFGEGGFWAFLGEGVPLVGNRSALPALC